MPQLANDRYERFCREYIIDGNGSRSAAAAGFSVVSARYRASELMKRPEIIERIDELRGEQMKRLDISADRTLREVARVAYSSIGDFVKWGTDGVTLIPSENLTPDQIAAVLEVSEGDGKKISIKLHSKIAALDKLMKHQGLLKEQVDVNHRGTVRFIPPVVVKSAPPESDPDESIDEESDD